MYAWICSNRPDDWLLYLKDFEYFLFLSLYVERVISYCNHRCSPTCLQETGWQNPQSLFCVQTRNMKDVSVFWANSWQESEWHISKMWNYSFKLLFKLAFKRNCSFKSSVLVHYYIWHYFKPSSLCLLVWFNSTGSTLYVNAVCS